MAAGKDGVQLGAGAEQSAACGLWVGLGSMGRSASFPSLLGNALFWWWPPPKLLLAFLAHNTGQERLLELRRARADRGEELLAQGCFVYEQPGVSQYMLEDESVSLHRPLMLDNGISAPPVSKFSRHLSPEPLHEPYFIQSVGAASGPLGWLWLGGMLEAIIDYGVSNLARVWQWRRNEVC